MTWLIHTCDMTRSYVWQDSFVCVTCLIHTCDMARSYVWHDSFIRVTWLIHMCDMSHSYVWYDSFTCVTWLIHMCDMTHMCDTTHSYVWHDSYVRHDPFICVTRLIHMCDMTQDPTVKLELKHRHKVLKVLARPESFFTKNDNTSTAEPPAMQYNKWLHKCEDMIQQLAAKTNVVHLFFLFPIYFCIVSITINGFTTRRHDAATRSNSRTATRGKPQRITLIFSFFLYIPYFHKVQ